MEDDNVIYVWLEDLHTKIYTKKCKKPEDLEKKFYPIRLETKYSRKKGCRKGLDFPKNQTHTEEVFLYNALKQKLDQLSKTKLLADHRKFMKENKPSKPKLISNASSSSDSLKNGLNQNSNGNKPQSKRVSLSQKHLLKEAFLEILNAHSYFAETLKRIIPTISAKQVQYLNSELSSESWRIGWRIGHNNDHEWALCPVGENPLCNLLFEKLPSKKKRQALEGRREALVVFSKQLRRIADECQKLPCRRQSSQKPKMNYSIKDLLEVVLEDPVIGQDIDRLPSTKTKPARCFDEHPLFVKEIIRNKQQMKFRDLKEKFSEIKESLKS